MVSKIFVLATAFASSAYAVGTVRLYHQCGGANYNGATECESGSVCQVQNDFYHQCVEDDSAASASACSIVYVTAGAESSYPSGFPSSYPVSYPTSSSAAISAPAPYTTSSYAAPAPMSSSSAYSAAPMSSSSVASAAPASSTTTTSAYVAAPSSYTSSTVAPVESSFTTTTSAYVAPASSSTTTTSAYVAPASSSTTTLAAYTSSSSSAVAPSSTGASYKASFTEYGSTDTWGSGNCNVATTACGFYSNPGYSAAVSQNEFGVGPGAGAGGGCGKCWKLTAETDSTGTTLSNAGNSIIVQVTNLCPASGNPLCAQSSLTGTNQYGANLNFDLCIDSGASAALFGSSGVGLAVGSAEEVDCGLWKGTIIH